MKYAMLKLKIAKNAICDRDTYLDILRTFALESHMPSEKSLTDATRCALTYKLRDFQSFEQDGKKCRAIVAAPTKTSDQDVLAYINVQERGADVRYTASVATVEIADGTYAHVKSGLDASKYQGIIDALWHTPLCEFGRAHVFEGDVRRTLDGIIGGTPGIVKMWPGVWLAMSDDDATRAHDIVAGIADVVQGDVLMTRLELDVSESNRRALADELKESNFYPTLNKLIERAEKPGANIERLEVEMLALYTQVETTSSLLGIEIDISDRAIELEEILAIAQADA